MLYQCRNSILALLAICIAGCTTTQNFAPNTPLAKVRFSSNNIDTTIYAQDLKACPERRQVYSKLVGNLFTPHEKIGVRGTAMSGIASEFLLPAGQPLLLAAEANQTPAVGVPGFRCGLGFEFTPTADKEYELNFTVNGQRCSVRAFELVALPNAEIERRAVTGVRHFRARPYDNLCSSH